MSGSIPPPGHPAHPGSPQYYEAALRRSQSAAEERAASDRELTRRARERQERFPQLVEAHAARIREFLDLPLLDVDQLVEYLAGKDQDWSAYRMCDWSWEQLASALHRANVPASTFDMGPKGKSLFGKPRRDMARGWVLRPSESFVDGAALLEDGRVIAIRGNSVQRKPRGPLNVTIHPVLLAQLQAMTTCVTQTCPRGLPGAQDDVHQAALTLLGIHTDRSLQGQADEPEDIATWARQLFANSIDLNYRKFPEGRLSGVELADILAAAGWPGAIHDGISVSRDASANISAWVVGRTKDSAVGDERPRGDATVTLLQRNGAAKRYRHYSGRIHGSPIENRPASWLYDAHDIAEIRRL